MLNGSEEGRRQQTREGRRRREAPVTTSSNSDLFQTRMKKTNARAVMKKTTARAVKVEAESGGCEIELPKQNRDIDAHFYLSTTNTNNGSNFIEKKKTLAPFSPPSFGR
ncbi:hypothetical protein QVD17_39278 [Tagetes erecta]|uniref:Uncharacterized protein n=1 Tax=Tagetes erecta TaxID=13708 RepID=A0AAD8NG34_TARER|nr:hypothetical protein QVD17_39278 [Tagetes erecta]